MSDALHKTFGGKPGKDPRTPGAGDAAPARQGRPVEPFERGIVSFVRRSSRLSPKLRKAWREDGPRYLLPLPRDPRGGSLSVDPALRFDPSYVRREWGNSNPLVVEVGTGQGENIAAAAAGHPGTNFLALEVYEQGIAHLLHRLGEGSITNVRIGEVNAPILFARNVSTGLLEEVWIWFPDPWPKMRHHKRRLVQPALAFDLHRCLRRGGLLRLATDSDDYALHIHEVMDKAPGWRNRGTRRVSLPTVHVGKGNAGLAPRLPHRLFVESERYPGRVITSYERKGLARGHTIHDLAYQAV